MWKTLRKLKEKKEEIAEKKQDKLDSNTQAIKSNITIGSRRKTKNQAKFRFNIRTLVNYSLKL